MLFIAPPHWCPTTDFARALTLCFAAWVVCEALNHVLGKSWRLGSTSRTADRASYWVLAGVSFCSFCLAYPGRILGWAVATGPVQYAGLALMVAGIALRQWAVFVLGRHFSVVVTIEADHRLITRGPYRWLRHPTYTGSFATLIGFNLCVGAIGSATLAIAILLPTFLCRVHIEERALLATFGDAYREYARNTWGFLPGW